MQQAEFERHVGAENICLSIADAIQRAAKLYQSSPGANPAEQKREPALTR
jgi:hypothetical protein